MSFIYLQRLINNIQMSKYTPVAADQLCRIMMSLPYRNSKQVKIFSEFDDRFIGNVPQTKLVDHIKIMMSQDKKIEQNAQMRRQKIKNKIKNQTRQQLKQIYLQSNFNNNTKYKQQFNLIDRARCSPKTAIQIFHNRSLLRTQQQIKVTSSAIMIEPKFTKYTHKKSIHIRSKIYSTANPYRCRVHSSLLNQRRSLFSKQKSRANIVENAQLQGQKLQPWRYEQEPQIEEPLFIRKRVVKK